MDKSDSKKTDDKKAKSVEDETRIVLGFDSVVINGEKITVSEFGFTQELDALSIAEPIIKCLADMYLDGKDPSMLDIEVVFTKHKDAMLGLLSISTGKPIDWFNTLKGKHVSPLFLTFWGMNSHFFTQRIASLYIMGHPDLLRKANDQSDSAKPSLP